MPPRPGGHSTGAGDAAFWGMLLGCFLESVIWLLFGECYWAAFWEVLLGCFWGSVVAH